jgi:heterotetrameric sarcosine oxidase gamma subunit
LAALAGGVATVLDLTDALMGYRITGTRAYEVVSSGCSLDLAAGALQVGRCARARYADLSVLLMGTSVGVDLYVGRSYQKHLEIWFEDVLAQRIESFLGRRSSASMATVERVDGQSDGEPDGES